MHGWLHRQLDRLSGRSALAQAIRYALNHWKGLILFLDDGRLELDTNIVERAMRRPISASKMTPNLPSGGRYAPSNVRRVDSIVAMRKRNVP